MAIDKEPTIEYLNYELETEPVDETNLLDSTTDISVDETNTLNDQIDNLNLYLRFNSNQIPTVVAGAGAGTTPGTPTLTNTNDTKGQISITTGTSTPAGVVVTLTFARNYQTAPIVILTPANAATANIMVSSKITAASTITTFTINSTTTALADATAYSWFYICLE